MAGPRRRPRRVRGRAGVAGSGTLGIETPSLEEIYIGYMRAAAQYLRSRWPFTWRENPHVGVVLPRIPQSVVFEREEADHVRKIMVERCMRVLADLAVLGPGRSGRAGLLLHYWSRQGAARHARYFRVKYVLAFMLLRSARLHSPVNKK